MNIKTLLARLFVVVYAVACLTAVIMEKKMNNNCTINRDYWFSEKMVSDAKQVADAECVWLVQVNDKKTPCVIEGFAEEERIKITGDVLAQVLDTHFYIEQNENVAKAMFFPIAMITYHVNSAEIKIVYSFLNAEVRVYHNDQLVKTATLYDARKLNDMFENF